MIDWHVIPVGSANRAAFLAYCREHGSEHDESYLPQDDFSPTAEYPAYLLVTGHTAPGQAPGSQAAIGAACLIREPEYVRRGIARFMILHALQPSRPAYAALLSALAPHVAELDYAYGFIPEQLTVVRQVWEELGLRVGRYAYVLAHPGGAAPSVDMPDGYSFQYVQASDQQGLVAFCELLNLGFAEHPERVDATPASLARDMAGPYGLPDGTILLWRKGRPLGTIRVERDDDPRAASIGSVAVHPDYRGHGLGRLLIRQALGVAAGHGLQPVYLSVSAGNEAAIRLYVSESFQEQRVMVCYCWRPGDASQVA